MDRDNVTDAQLALHRLEQRTFTKVYRNTQQATYTFRVKKRMAKQAKTKMWSKSALDRILEAN